MLKQETIVIRTNSCITVTIYRTWEEISITLRIKMIDFLHFLTICSKQVCRSNYNTRGGLSCSVFLMHSLFVTDGVNMQLRSTMRGYDIRWIRVAPDDRAHNWPPAHYMRRREARASFSTQWRATPRFRVKCPRELLANDNCIVILVATMMPTTW